MNLLLHICCGPCTCYPLKALRAAGIEPTGYFFNHNIHPYAEWERRLKAAKEFAVKSDWRLIADENYRLREFLVPALAVEEDDNPLAPRRRCRSCYAYRLEATARFAVENGFDAFSTTLLYSIYQQHEIIKEVAATIAEKYGLTFYYDDWRGGWDEGITISKELELYRQPYCGCIFSEEERYSKAIHKARHKAGRALKAARLARERDIM